MKVRDLAAHPCIALLGLAVCALFVLGAAVNEGVTGPVLGLPFLVLGAVIVRARFRTRSMIAAAMAYLLACVLLWRSLPTSQLVHPVIGEPLELVKPIDVYEGSEKWNGIGGLAYVNPHMVKGFKEDGEEPGGERRTLGPGTRLRISRLHVKNPDFETKYAFEFRDNQGRASFVVAQYDWESAEFCSLVRFRLCGMEYEERRDAVTRPVFQALGMLMLYPLLPVLMKGRFDAFLRNVWRRG